ncbi:HAD-IA family hydrolase [Pararhodobacter sp.]|uniref:HAD-IA family hydrolase n=1 Tax=Pararhodobacter sp. TaxID=2127056 RepID=UPI002AFFDAFA|nr:HAD-IA family hydrolase [Pararhodobacter sp.]
MTLVIFDVDGTLVDSQAHIVGAMEFAFAALGLTCPPRAAVLGIVGLSLPQAMTRLAPEADNAGLVEAYKSSYTKFRAAETSPLYPGALEVLRSLRDRADIVLGVATGKSRRGLDHVLAAHGLDGFFQTTQVADDHPSKPHPSMVLTAMRETGADPRDTVMIGDTSFDMEMGHAAGVRCIGVSWGYHPVSELRLATSVIDHFDALSATLETLRRQP